MSAKILVVEDSFETRDSLTILLELSGYEVIVASDGDEGLAKALAEAPDLIVTDIRMPSVSGIEMLREFRRNLRHRVIPVLVVTGYSKDYANEAFEAGADRRLMPEISGKSNHVHPRVVVRQIPQNGRRLVSAAVINENKFVIHSRPAPQGRANPPISLLKHLLFVETWYDY